MCLRKISACLALSAAMASCALGEEPVGGGIRDIPTSATKGGFDARISGVLDGDAEVDGGCLWLEKSGERVSVVWPHGYRARFDPPRLVAPDGTVVATAGDRVRSGGGLVPTAMPRCDVGEGERVLILNGEVEVIEEEE